MWNLKINPNFLIQNRNRLTDIETYFWLLKGRGKKGGTNYGYGINRCKLLYIK